MLLQWTKKLSALPLCMPPETCGDDYMVNAAAISDDGTRAVAGTYYQHYVNTTREAVDGHYGIYAFDTANPNNPFFVHEFDGDKGIYAVAISGNGRVAAGGGLLRAGSVNPFTSKRGLLRAFDVCSGQLLLDTSDFTDRVNSVALSRDGGVLVAVSESSLHVFLRQNSGLFAKPPQFIDLSGYCETVAVHPSGTWLAAADQNGTVYVSTITGGLVSNPTTWVALEPEDPGLANSLDVPVRFHSVAISRTADMFAVGGGDVVYLLTPASMQASPAGPVGRFTSFDATGKHNVRWVAIADDGSFVTAVVNDKSATGTPLGRLIKVSCGPGGLTKAWEAQLDHPPNSTSIDGAGNLITAATGFPNHVPAAFYLFDTLGQPLGKHPTADMNWPMQVSRSGTGIIAGSDDNTLLFFTP